MNRRTVLSVTICVAGWLVGGRVMAGSLEPTNAPAPTMHTLEECYQQASVVLSVRSNLVAKTGQTVSYATDDDGALQAGVAWPNPRFAVEANTNVVKDNLTGLIWARNANLFGATNWGAAVTNCNDLDYGGYTDWRLPNCIELFSLIDHGRKNPCLCNTAGTGQLTDNDPFTGVQGSYYWSSTTFAQFVDFAYYASMQLGYVPNGSKSSYAFFVWPVRGGRR